MLLYGTLICEILSELPYIICFRVYKYSYFTSSSFYPFSWHQAPLLFKHQTRDEWRIRFQDSYSVHFYASSQPRNRKIMKLRHYGKEVPAYLHLGLDNCPLSFDSGKTF